MYTIPTLRGKQYQKSYWTTELSAYYETTQDSLNIPGWQTVIHNIQKLNDKFKRSLLSFPTLVQSI